MNKQNLKKLFITLFRVAIGWHFLYEGLAKLWMGNWSATSYLANATGPFARFYHWLAAFEGLMKIVDPVNIAGLILIGLGLFPGLAIRLSSVSGIILLILYYFAYPPFSGDLFGAAEGNLYIVNKNLIEALALVTLLFIKEKGFGFCALPVFSFKKKFRAKPAEEKQTGNSRREVLKNLATLPPLRILGWGAFRNSQRYGWILCRALPSRLAPPALAS